MKTYREIVLLITFIVLIGLGSYKGVETFLNWRYPNNLIPDNQDIIHHPVYGNYPAIVPFQQGMDIMPGQTAEIEIIIKIPPHAVKDESSVSYEL